MRCLIGRRWGAKNFNWVTYRYIIVHTAVKIITYCLALVENLPSPTHPPPPKKKNSSTTGCLCLLITYPYSSIKSYFKRIKSVSENVYSYIRPFVQHTQCMRTQFAGPRFLQNAVIFLFEFESIHLLPSALSILIFQFLSVRFQSKTRFRFSCQLA